MQFRSHNPDDKITKIADVVYDPNARCPRFEQFLTEVMSGDADKSAFLQKHWGTHLAAIPGTSVCSSCMVQRPVTAKVP